MVEAHGDGPVGLNLYSNPRGLYRFQAEIVAKAYLRPRNIAIVDTGLGKGLEVGTGVLRPDGSWTPVQDLLIGDLVVGGDGHPVVVEGVFDRGVQPGYRVTTDDGVSINVDADHLWTVATDLDLSRGIPWRTLDTKTLSETVDAPGRKRWRIPVVSHHGGGGWLPVDPYILGVLLGDGHISGGQVGFTSVDDGIVAMVKERLPNGIEMHVDMFTAKPPRYRLVGSTYRHNHLLEALRELGVHGCRSWEKFVPEMYLRASEEDRRALLAGLMDTDGWVGSAQQFTSTSERLSRDVAYLVRSLGGVARVTKKTTTHRDAYNVTIRMDRCPFWLERKVDRWEEKPRLGVTRKIASIEPIEGGVHSVCIKVSAEDGLFITEGFVVTHNTHLALALIALLIEDNQIDRAIVVVEGNKVDEWMDDIAEFTQLSAVKYRGDPRARRNRLRKRFESHVLVSTYQTLREDLVDGKRKLEPGYLMKELEGERILVVYDEVTALGGRTSQTHKAHRFFAHSFDARLLGLTATPVTSGAESYYNLGRIFCPDLVGTVEEFYKRHVVRFDAFRNPSQYRDLDVLAEKMAPVILRKRKTDPDVVDQFPTTVEDFVKVRLNDDHQEMYNALRDLADEVNEEQRAPAFQILCAFANHPRSIFSSQSALAAEFLSRHSAEDIEKLVCAKTESVLRKMQAVTDQGDQAIVFCNSVHVLDELYADAVKKGLSVARYHGGISNDTREANKAAFKAGDVKILLCSSAGERGINLPEASYIINYDVPVMHSSYIQRLSRASRIGSNAGEILVVVTYIAAGSAEEASVRIWNRRNAQSDTLIDHDVDPADEYFTSASDRKHMIKEASKR